MKQQDYLEIIEQNKGKHHPPLETLVQGRKLSSDNKKDSHDYSEDYLTFVARENGTFTFTPKNNNVISYSTDNGKTWTEGNNVEVSNGDKVMWKGTMTSESYSGVGTFSSTAEFDVQANIMSLLYGDNFKGQTDLTGKIYAFYLLFYNNTKVVNAENLSLPATTLANNCYESMFQFCTNLTTAPVLPATTLAEYCYRNMFQNCRSLTTAPALPATTLVQYCYIAMFSGCTNLTTAPELPATTLANYCYTSMFRDCTSLVTAPVLPATTLTDYCYQYMFNGCTSLVNAPELPATTLADRCYLNMFNNTNIIPDCSNIDFTSETVVSSGGLRGLFGGTKITDADLERILPKNTNEKYCLPVTTLADNCYNLMFSGCINLTTAPELPATTLANGCYSSMFSGCTALTTAPELPATTMTCNCYRELFKNCTSLTTAPDLPATTLYPPNVTGDYDGTTAGCYYQMFYGCSSLNYIKAMFIACTWTQRSSSSSSKIAYCTKDWVSGVASTGTFVKNSAAQWNVTGVNGIPTGWTVETASE